MRERWFWALPLLLFVAVYFLQRSMRRTWTERRLKKEPLGKSLPRILDPPKREE